MSETIWQALLLVVAALVVAEAIVLVAVMRQLGSVLLQVRPAWAQQVEGGPDTNSHVEIPGVDWHDGLVLVFVAPGCAPCEALVPHTFTLRARHPGLEVVAAIEPGDDAQRAAFAETLGDAARVELAHLFAEWNVTGTPYAVAVDSEHRVRLTGVVNSIDQLETMAEAALASPQLHASEDEIEDRELAVAVQDRG